MKKMDKHRCWICGAEMQEKEIITSAGWGKYKTEVKAKAYVCPNCGEIVFTSDETHRLQELGKKLAGSEINETV